MQLTYNKFFKHTTLIDLTYLVIVNSLNTTFPAPPPPPDTVTEISKSSQSLSAPSSVVAVKGLCCLLPVGSPLAASLELLLLEVAQVPLDGLKML